MQRHLREAIELNRARMPLYAALTAGRSRAVSRRLIRAERLALPAAWVIDRRARRWQEHGIPIACAEFVPMSATPAFRARADGPLPPPFVPIDARRIRRAVAAGLREGGFPGASAVLAAELARLEAAPAYHCMVRHLLESALRVSNLAPLHDEQARARGLPSTRGLSRTLFDLHLVVLGEAARLDRRAAPLQAEGVPIVCRDVPPIPPY